MREKKQWHASSLGEGTWIRFGDACKILRMARSPVEGLILRGELIPRWNGGHRVFKRTDVIQKAAALGRIAGSEGNAQRVALDLMTSGKTNTEIVMALAMPLDLVRELRAQFEADQAPSRPTESEPHDTLRPPSSSPPPSNGAAHHDH